MKIFITGLAGFLGSHLADRMIELGHEVVGNDTLIGGYVDNVPLKAKLYVVDCCDVDHMTQIMKGCDIVIHTAATAHEGLSVFSPSFITRNIFEASVATISAAIQNKVKRFVYCTSMARYGEQQTPFTEDMQPAPVDPYGISKVAGEDVIKNLCKLNKIEWVIAVPHNIIGPKQKYNDPFRNVVSIIINRLLQNKRPIIFGDGEQKRCFSYIDDCIYCLLALIDRKDVIGEIINIGPDEEFVTINKIAEICSNITGSNLKPEYYPDRPQEVKNAICSSNKARKLLKYKTTIDLFMGIKKTFEYIKKKGPKKFNYYVDLEIVNDLTPKVWVEKKI